ncbi:MAG TPA: hypothetical protein PK829_06000 [Promineifilum sp.]|nr:hypothetical protein [Promineifilum sp.]
MKTLSRIALILLAAVLIAGATYALAQSGWADSFTNSVIGANQAQMTATHDALQAAGAQPESHGEYFAMAGNLLKIALVAAGVILLSVVLEKRAKLRLAV